MGFIGLPRRLAEFIGGPGLPPFALTLMLILVVFFVLPVVEMSQITLPVGFNRFALQGLTRRDITGFAKVSRPMFALMLGIVLLMWFVPGLATGLPAGMQG